MATKDLYNGGAPSQEAADTTTISSESLDSLGANGESAGNVQVQLQEARVFLPPIDFETASNFAVYGSAEKYYEDSVERIYTQYPYDGSEKEKTEFLLSSSYLDRYVLEERYPRTNGFVKFSHAGWGTRTAVAGEYGATATSSYEYISFNGGPHSTLNSTDPISDAYSGSRNQTNVFDVSTYRGSNLALNPPSGSTVEFWLKKEAFAPATTTKKEVIFDLWNSSTGTSAPGTETYGRLMIELSGTATDDESPFRITYQSGTSGFKNHGIGANVTTGNVADDTWNHYAVSFLSSSTDLVAKLYVNGVLNDTQVTGSTVSEITGNMVANIGALRTSPTGLTLPEIGWGKLSASLDEFRYWKTRRTSEEIGKNWFTQVRGGTNSDDANTALGVYYKFNEGISGDSSIDSSVLDYSGRITNGTWTGYSTNARETGSAMVLSNAADREFKDPIIYPSHPEVETALISLKQSGSVHDYENNSSLYHSLPSWITEEDTSGDLKNLVQIVASYFDKLQNQIKVLPELRNPAYLSSSYKPAPFANKLISNAGVTSPEIFIDTSVLDEISSRDESREYELDINDIRNRIYQNIYNNLVYINKAKGTEKAFRNLIHCYGIDEDLIRLNTYGNNVTYELKNNFRSRAVATNLVDFNDPKRFNATVFQYTASAVDNSVGFISGTAGGVDLGSEDYLGLTLEAEVVFPKKEGVCVSGSVETTFVKSSLFGMHSANTTDVADTTWPADDFADIRISAIRDTLGSNDAKFQLESGESGISTMNTVLYKDVYDNTKWNLALRVIPEKYPIGDSVVGTTESGSAFTDTPFKIELYGVNMDLDVVRNEFFLSGTLTNTVGTNLMRSAKRVFAGAHLTNFTGSTVNPSDVRISSVRYWANYLPNEVIRAHARDTENYGTLNPSRNAFLTQNSLTGTYVPEIETLALHWNFANITGSDSSGKFTVLDYSSGSSELQSRYGWYGNIVKAQHTGEGRFFPTNSTQAIDRDYIYSAKQSLPEIVNTSEMINIMSEDDINFVKTSRPVSYFMAIEKSMYQVISDDMVNMFATIKDFNNLIGDPVNRYRQIYKAMEKIRFIYFENIEGTPDLDKFIGFYKWIDSSLSSFLQQLVPASADTSGKISNLIENHVLERNKYWSKYTNLKRSSPIEETIVPSAIGGGGDGYLKPRSATDPTYSYSKTASRGTRSALRPSGQGGSVSTSGRGEKDRVAGPGGTAFTPAGTSRRKGSVGGAGVMEPGGGFAKSPARTRGILDPVRGSRPVSELESEHQAYWLMRAPRDVGTLASGDAGVDADRQAILRVLQSGYMRDRNRPYVLNLIHEKTIHGGTNYSENKDRHLIMRATEPFGPRADSGTPLNVLMFDDVDIISFQNVTDVVDPNEKRNFSFKASFRREDETGVKGVGNNTYTSVASGELAAPFNLASGSVESGYNSLVETRFKSGSVITNLHSDTFLTNNEIPMQGPFSQQHVGGHQSRNVTINRYDASKSTPKNLDDYTTRPEGWRALLGDAYDTTDNQILGFVGPDYPQFSAGTYPQSEYNRAVRYRNVGAKRPVNIRNIKHTTSSVNLGNYSKEYEIIQGGSRSTNNKYFVQNDGVTLPDLYTSTTLYNFNRKQISLLSGTLGNIGCPGYRIVTHASLNDPTEFCFSMWVSCSNPAAQSTTRYLISIGSDGASGERSMHINTSNKMVFKVGYTTTDGVWTSDSAVWSTAGWHHFALTYKDGDGDATFYINGDEAGGSFSPSPNGTFETPGSDSTLFSRRNNSTGLIVNNTSFYSGSVAEASYWNKKLTTAEVTEIYNRGDAQDNPGPQDLNQHSAASNLVSWWRFGDFSNDVEMDMHDAKSSNDALGIATAASNGMELTTLTDADLLLVAGGKFTEIFHMPATTNIASAFGSVPRGVNGGNYFGNKNSAPGTLSNLYNPDAQISDPDRGKNSSFLVTRFSAPGGVDVGSPAYLDNIAGEKSVYNALPFRNLQVRGSGSGEDNTIGITDHLGQRRGLRTLRSLHAGKFGHDSTYGSVPSVGYVTQPAFQKNNRNTRTRYEFVGEKGFHQAAAVEEKTVFDNANVTHAIPRSDLQYSWISSSFQSKEIFGHAFGDSFISDSSGVKQAITFISSSFISASFANMEGIRVDFVNLNTLVNDPIDITNNILSSSNVSSYLNTQIGSLNSTDYLNALLLHRNGPYGVNSWKQTRVGESPVARSLRQRNIISFVEKNNLEYPPADVASDPKPKYGSTISFTESPVSMRFKPLTQNITIDELLPDGNIQENQVSAQTSYGNIVGSFNNQELVNRYNISQQRETPYDDIKRLYLNGGEADPNSPVRSFGSLVYGECVYPAGINAFSSSIRIRKDYQNNFWRDARSDRTLTNVSSVSHVVIPSESMWPLDANEDFLTDNQWEANTSVGGAGVLQNQYSQVHMGIISKITASAYYARRHDVDSKASVSYPSGLEIPSTGTINLFTKFFTVPLNGFQQFLGGQAKWDAPGQAGKNPWYNSYDDYAVELRALGKSYSIVPEFRISDHIDYYVTQKGGDFLAENPTLLIMTGGLSDRDRSDKQDFFKTYTNSDFLKYFKLIREEHEDIAQPSAISLECSALLKFLPYDGFYPAERTVQMAKQFSASYGPHVALKGGTTETSIPSIGFRAFMAPFYAPGIMFNTIKSGIAVDYPMFSASMDKISAFSKATELASKFISGSGDSGRFHYRIPFESLVEPEKYITDKDMVDMEVHLSTSINATASWGGGGDDLYKMMAHNFFAEVPEFFLPDQQFATLTSKPESRFESVKIGERFVARVKMFKSLDRPMFRTGNLGYRNPFVPLNVGTDEADIHETFTMYSRPTAFGPPCAGNAYEFDYTALNGINTPFTPPYYNGESWADIFFTSPRTSTTDKPITLQEIFSPANLSISYSRIGSLWSTTSDNVMLSSGNIEHNSMQLDASLNLLGKAQVKNLIYNPATGQPTSVSDSEENVWVIQPKFETPMLNFSGAVVTNPTYGSASVARGMWHQYGDLPDDPSKGIFMQITDIPDNYIEKALGGTPADTGSLVDLVGFSTAPKRLGEIADTKLVREAVVAIPFIEEAGERNFFSLSRRSIDLAVRVIDFEETPDPNDEFSPGGSIIDMVRSMKRYVFPPTMDFLQNPDRVDPFAMYIFEFEHAFDKQDLADMWQNLPPKIAFSLDTLSNTYNSGLAPPSRQIQKRVKISHELMSQELLTSETPSRIQWMVFKVKQRANKNYFSKVVKDSVNQGQEFQRSLTARIGREDSGKSFDPPYSYNWPYDFFSLVELVKLDAEMEISKRDEE